MKLKRWPEWVPWETAVRTLGQPECQAEYLALRGILSVRMGETGLEVSRDSLEDWMGFEPELMMAYAGKEVVQ